MTGSQKNKKKKKDIAASVRQRLLNQAHETGQDFQRLLVRYGVQRLLYRLSQSAHRDRFVLKGAMLFVAWTDAAGRDRPRRSNVARTASVSVVAWKGKVSATIPSPDRASLSTWADNPGRRRPLRRAARRMQVRRRGVRFSRPAAGARWRTR